MYGLSFLFIFLGSFFCSHCTNARYKGYPSSMFSSEKKLNSLFALLIDLVVIGSSRSTVVDGNLLRASATMLSTPDM